MSHSKQRILLVDDDPGIMMAVKQALTTHGYEMMTATDGLEALDAFERESPPRFPVPQSALDRVSL